MLLQFTALFLLIRSRCSAQIFSEEPQDLLVPQGSKAIVEFTCRAELTNPTYVWRKDNNDIVVNGTRQKIYGGTLQISSPQTSDEGIYHCVAIGTEGKAASNPGKLSFAYITKDSEKSSTEHVKVITGEGAVIPCRGVKYAPKDKVQFYWQKLNAIEILKPPGDNTFYISPKTGDLYLGNLMPKDSDLYECNVRSRWKSHNSRLLAVSAPVVINVTVTGAEILVRPKLLLHEDEVVADLGGNVLLKCFAAGNPVPKMTWWKRNDQLPTNHNVTQAGQLLLWNITEKFAGEYICMAENNVTTVTANATTVLRIRYKPRWTEEIRNVVEPESVTARLRCGAEAAPPPTIRWMKNNEMLINPDRVVITTNNGESVLSIGNAKGDDSGIYQCVALNSLGRLISNARLTIASFAPTFISPVANVTKATIGNDVTIVCEVRASPAANVTWKKNGIDILLDKMRYFQGSSGSLTIHNVACSDAAKYMCIAENHLGSISDEGNLQVFSTNINHYETSGTHPVCCGFAILLSTAILWTSANFFL